MSPGPTSLCPEGWVETINSADPITDGLQMQLARHGEVDRSVPVWTILGRGWGGDCEDLASSLAVIAGQDWSVDLEIVFPLEISMNVFLFLMAPWQSWSLQSQKTYEVDPDIEANLINWLFFFVSG